MANSFLHFTINVTEMFLVLPHNPIPLLNHSYINPLNTELNPICHFLALLGTHPILHISRIRVNEFCICSEAELLKQVYVLVFQANTCLKHADIVRLISVKRDKMWEKLWCYWLDNREILMLLAEQPRNTGATGWTIEKYWWCWLNNREILGYWLNNREILVLLAEQPRNTDAPGWTTEKYWSCWLNNREILMLLAEQPRNTGATGWTTEKYWCSWLNNRKILKPLAEQPKGLLLLAGQPRKTGATATSTDKSWSYELNKQ